jgi:hypothetical protein
VPASSINYKTKHCEKLFSHAEDDPDLHEGSEPRQSLLLLRVLRESRNENDILRSLERTFLLETDPENVVRYVSNGCLFYKFISTGLEKLLEDRRRYNQMRANGDYVDWMNNRAIQIQAR